MTPPGKKLPSGPPRLYTRLLRAIGHKMASRPENKRLSYREQQKLISQKVYPALKEQKGYIKAADIEKAVTSGLRKWTQEVNAAAARYPSYNTLFHELSEINKSLPKEERHNVKALQGLASQVYQAYKERDEKVSLKKARADLKDLYKRVPPDEICDVNYLDESLYKAIPAWMMPYDLETKFEPCIWVKVSAGQYGETDVFNLKNYQGKYRNQVMKIKNQTDSINGLYPYYDGFVKLRKGKKNDGTPDNYYLHFILFIDEKPVDDIKEVKAKIPATSAAKKKKEKISDYILDRIEALKEKGRREKKARQTREKEFKVIKITKGRTEKLETPGEIIQGMNELQKAYNKTLTILGKQVEKGYITPEYYQQQLKAANADIKRLQKNLGIAQKNLARSLKNMK